MADGPEIVFPPDPVEVAYYQGPLLSTLRMEFTKGTIDMVEMDRGALGVGLRRVSWWWYWIVWWASWTINWKWWSIRRNVWSYRRCFVKDGEKVVEAIRVVRWAKGEEGGDGA